jgi:hypothetical protein
MCVCVYLFFMSFFGAVFKIPNVPENVFSFFITNVYVFLKIILCHCLTVHSFELNSKRLHLWQSRDTLVISDDHDRSADQYRNPHHHNINEYCACTLTKTKQRDARTKVIRPEIQNVRETRPRIAKSGVTKLAQEMYRDTCFERSKRSYRWIIHNRRRLFPLDCLRNRIIIVALLNVYFIISVAHVDRQIRYGLLIDRTFHLLNTITGHDGAVAVGRLTHTHTWCVTYSVCKSTLSEKG